MWFSDRDGVFSDGLAGDATNGDWYARWAGGVGFASIPLIIGVLSILNESTLFFAGRPPRLVQYHGLEAIALGATWIGIGMFMHAHYFWTVSRQYYFISELLKPASLLTIVGSIGYVIVRIVLYT